ncbi:uncharacterized protein JCM10292_001174 [Rhodotorula paludigena]|uniref:uncharacterized protein n=1 Tax=Rhodotorula paludigena TaxID=86838 RepID=UPI003179C765
MADKKGKYSMFPPPDEPLAEEPPKKKKFQKWNPFKKGGASDANSLAHLSRFGPGRRAVIYGELPTTSAAAAGRY